jgi:putative tryptophan/tyrosine transport system substrate-binding protein
MKRREVIAGLAGAAAWSSSGWAQSTASRYRVGMLDTSSRQLNVNFVALQRALLERGYVEGQNLTFEYRSADGGNEAFAELARELVRLDVDVIATRGTPAALAAKAASTTIPVVMAAAGDPLAIARNPARPAMNMTGFGASVSGAEGKRIEILKHMLSKVERVAALLNLSNPSRRAEWNEIEASTRSMGIAAQVLDTRTIADIERSFDAASRSHADALVVGSDTLMQTNQSLVVRLAAAHRMPAMYTFRDFVNAGGLVSYGVSLPDLYRRAAGYVDRILKGARPDELPIQQPTRLELVVNLKAAKALGITIPETFLTRADELIQ